MRHVPVLLAFAFAFVTLAGCVDLGGSDYTPRTLEFTIEVAPGMDTTVPVYTMNDGETMQRIVASGFRSPGTDLEIPNPTIRIKEGDTLILNIVNNNPMPHTFHLHGGLDKWEMDGVPHLTQMPIHQGESFQYVFSDMKAGTYWYHCHVDAPHHIDLGMFGAFIVEEIEPTIEFDREFVLMLDEMDTCHVHGNTDPLTSNEFTTDILSRAECVSRVATDYVSQNQILNPVNQQICNDPNLRPLAEEAGIVDCEGHQMTPPYAPVREWYPVTFPVYNPEYNTYTINGKSYPDTKPLIAEDGETIKIRMINVGFEMHSMHLHGHTMLVTHRDGYELPAPFKVDTLGIMPGERYDVIVKMNNPGYWPFHDHVGLNVMNDNISPGGMLTYLAYDDFRGRDASGYDRSLDVLNAAIEILAEGGGHQGHGRAEAQAFLDGKRYVAQPDGSWEPVYV